MKKLTILTIASLSLLFSSCIKNRQDCCIVPFHPFIGYKIGDLSIFGDASSEKVGADSISVISNRSDSKLTMHIKYHGKGTYILTGNQAVYAYKNAPGNFTTTYNISTKDTSKVEITEVDSLNRIVSGRFRLNLKKISGTTPGAQPDSLALTNGQFDVALPAQ